MVGLNITRDQILSSSENDYTLQVDHDQEEQHFIQKSLSCPIPYLRVSRWNVAKVHVKQKVLSAAKKINMRSPSMSKSSSGSRSKLIQDDDGLPVVLVGPVIGLVTTSTARILLEIDKTEEIQMILQPLIIASPDHSHLRPSENLSISQRHSGSNFDRSNTMEGCSKISTIWRGASSKTNLSKEPYNFIAAEETDTMAMLHDHSLELSSEDINIMSPLVLMNGQQEYTSITNREKRSRGLKLRKRRNSMLHRALSSDSPFLGSADMLTETDQLYNVGSHPVSSRKSSSSSRPRKETSFNIVSKRLRKASGYKPLSMESANIYSTGLLEKHKQDSIVLTKKLEAKRPCVFEFTGLQPETRYMVKLAGCHEAVKTSSFRTFPEKPSKCFRMAAISCNSIFITKKTITNISDLWSHLFKSIKEGRIDLVIHLGDQIYGDGDRHLDAGAGKNRDKWSNRFKIGLDILKDVPKEQWISKKEVICEKYREVYRETWKHPHTANCLAHCPNLMIYDDHEIRDNWGDNQSDWCRDHKMFFVAQCAWIVTMEYQRQLYEDIDFLNLEGINKDYHFHVIGKVGLMFLDIRGSRTFHRKQGDPKPYLGSRQWEDIKHALGHDGLFKEVQALVICSPAPLVFLIPSITSVLGRTVHRLEDFKGHWSHHNKEQMEMIECLNTWKSARSGREVIVLGGDVHCGGHSRIMKSGETLFYQLTTSAIANMPLPKSAYYFMRLAEQLEHIREGIKFRHFSWTRARNYGLIQVKMPPEEDGHSPPEIIMQLVKGKFLRHVKLGRKVSNAHKDITAMTPFSPFKRELINIFFKACHASSCSSSWSTHESAQHTD